MKRPSDVWLASGVRTPLAKVDGPLQKCDAIELSVPVARYMVDLLKAHAPTSPCGAPWCPAYNGAI